MFRPNEKPNQNGEHAQGSILSPIFGDLSQSEKLSEIKTPLARLKLSFVNFLFIPSIILHIGDSFYVHILFGSFSIFLLIATTSYAFFPIRQPSMFFPCH